MRAGGDPAPGAFDPQRDLGVQHTDDGERGEPASDDRENCPSPADRVGHQEGDGQQLDDQHGLTRRAGSAYRRPSDPGRAMR